MGNLSAHFSDAEFTCRHCGRLDGRVLPELVAGLEALRASAYSVTGLTIASGYRCAEHNRAVGGAAQSQHVLRAAADVQPRVTLAHVRELGAFSGIGWQLIGGRRLVRHVDVRHASAHNPTGGTTTRPTTWEYLPDGSRR